MAIVKIVPVTRPRWSVCCQFHDDFDFALAVYEDGCPQYAGSRNLDVNSNRVLNRDQHCKTLMKPGFQRAEIWLIGIPDVPFLLRSKFAENIDYA